MPNSIESCRIDDLTNSGVTWQAQDVRKVLSSRKGILSGGAGHGHELVTAQAPAPAIEGSLRQTCLMEDLPVDWSLKTFCRFSSDQSFEW